MKYLTTRHFVHATGGAGKVDEEEGCGCPAPRAFDKEGVEGVGLGDKVMGWGERVGEECEEWVECV